MDVAVMSAEGPFAQFGLERHDMGDRDDFAGFEPAKYLEGLRIGTPQFDLPLLESVIGTDEDHWFAFHFHHCVTGNAQIDFKGGYMDSSSDVHARFPLATRIFEGGPGYPGSGMVVDLWGDEVDRSRLMFRTVVAADGYFHSLGDPMNVVLEDIQGGAEPVSIRQFEQGLTGVDGFSGSDAQVDDFTVEGGCDLKWAKRLAMGKFDQDVARFH